MPLPYATGNGRRGCTAPSQEIYTLDDLQQKFSLDRITKSPAVFDKTKLAWMNGQHLRAMPTDEVSAHALHG